MPHDCLLWAFFRETHLETGAKSARLLKKNERTDGQGDCRSPHECIRRGRKAQGVCAGMRNMHKRLFLQARRAGPRLCSLLTGQLSHRGDCPLAQQSPLTNTQNQTPPLSCFVAPTLRSIHLQDGEFDLELVRARLAYSRMRDLARMTRPLHHPRHQPCQCLKQCTHVLRS